MPGRSLQPVQGRAALNINNWQLLGNPGRQMYLPDMITLSLATHGPDVWDNQTSDAAGVNSPIGRQTGRGTRAKENQTCFTGGRVSEAGVEGLLSSLSSRGFAEQSLNWVLGLLPIYEHQRYKPTGTSWKPLRRLSGSSGLRAVTSSTVSQALHWW